MMGLTLAFKMKKAKKKALESRVENCHPTDEGYFFGESSGQSGHVIWKRV